MALTIGAVVLLVGLIFLVYYGYTIGIKKSTQPGEENLLKCSLCLKRFDRSQLVERQVGDSRLFYFCETCIQSLHQKLDARNRDLLG
jgi:hypothetical protein